MDFLVRFGAGPNLLPATLMQACPRKRVVVLHPGFVVWGLLCLIWGAEVEKGL